MSTGSRIARTKASGPVQAPVTLSPVLTSGVPPGAGHGWPVWGNSAVINELQVQVAGDRVRHAIMLSGVPGIGKAHLAKTFSQSLLCLAPPAAGTPCLQCRSCRKIDRNVHPDVRIVSLESQAAEAERTGGRNTSLTIETIRDVCSLAAFRPMEGKWRVTIVEDAETLQGVAQEALLKTLEEPPSFMVMLLLTDDMQALIPTVRSRCQVLEVRPVSRSIITDALEGAGLNHDTAVEIASLADGRLGWAFDAAVDASLIATRAGELRRGLEWIQASGYDRLVTALRLADGYTKQRAETFADLQALTSIWRDILLSHTGQTGFVRHLAQRDTISTMALRAELSDVCRALTSVQSCISDLESNVRPRLALEHMVLQWPTSANRT